MRVDPEPARPAAAPDLRPEGVKPQAHRDRACRPRRAPRCGKVVFTADDAEAWASQGKQVILVRIETAPDDIHGMHAPQGILTARGGMTSHAAVVARGMGKPASPGCGALQHRRRERRR